MRSPVGVAIQRGSVAFTSFLFLSALTLAGASPARGEGEALDRSPSLSDLGVRWERLRAGSPVMEEETIKSLASSLDELRRGDMSSEERGASAFLSGEMFYALGDYERAAKEFKSGSRTDNLELFADDAVFALISLMEAQGEDEKAKREWAEWEQEYPRSPLRPEARLAQAWNAIRRGTLSEAEAVLLHIKEDFPWMEGDRRLALADATIKYLQGHFQEALACLPEESQVPAGVYLKALIHTEMGSYIKAAACHQEVAERFPYSALRDYSLLAKADIFMRGNAYESAAEEFMLVAERATNPEIQTEARLRGAVSLYLAEKPQEAETNLRDIVMGFPATEAAARAQFLLGELLFAEGAYEQAIQEFNRVLTDYFDHSLAATALYRTARALDALERQHEATSTYQAVVSGYPMTPEAPAAAYLAGVGLLDQSLPLQAAPYFQLVLDRYATQDSLTVVFASPDQQELVEAALCLLQLSYHQAGDLGQLSGVPHLMLQKMPPSGSPWRAYALLIDADAMASQSRYADAQSTLEKLLAEFPQHEAAVPANRLLAWTYARQGKYEQAIATEERMLALSTVHGDMDGVGSAYLNQAHNMFNRKQYAEAAEAYEEFANQFPHHDQRQLALYQAGFCYQRLGRSGDAVDRWEQVVESDPSSPVAERAWIRAGDVYFQSGHYDQAKRSYQGLLDYFPQSSAASLGMLRMAQCEYNAGHDSQALERFSAVIERYPGTDSAVQAEKGMEQALYRLGQQDNGSEVLGELIERYPNSAYAADAQFEIATRMYEEESYLEAAEQFRRVVSQFPGYTSADKAQYFMAESFARSGSEEEALNAYEQFLLFFPDSELRSTVQFNLGALRFSQEDFMRAAVSFTSVMEADPSDELRSAALFNLALCQRMLGDLEQAQSLLHQYRQEHPPADERAVEVAYYLGDILETTAKLDEAAGEYERALRLDPTPETAVELQYRLGYCQERQGDPVAAIAAYQRAMKCQDKNNSFRLSAVARCAALYEERQEFTKAAAAYRDLAAYSTDQDLMEAARERAAQLESLARM